jgi:hypothetical protein
MARDTWQSDRLAAGVRAPYVRHGRTAKLDGESAIALTSPATVCKAFNSEFVKKSEFKIPNSRFNNPKALLDWD